MTFGLAYSDDLLSWTKVTNGLATLMALAAILIPSAAGAKITPLSPELQAEAMLQYQRLDSLRRGKRPMSRFARPELVHRQASLLLSSDRDPADIVVRRARTIREVITTFNQDDRHGRTSSLSERELDALEQYVLSL